MHAALLNQASLRFKETELAEEERKRAKQLLDLEVPEAWRLLPLLFYGINFAVT